jgi:putative ABC transport system permease protein
MANLLRDVRVGLRLLAKRPGFTAVAVLTLALGIGANTAIFSVVYGTLLERLPYRDADQLVMVWSKPQPDSRNSVAAGDFLDWRAQSTVFQGLHAWTGRSYALATGADRPEQVQAAPVTPGWIENFGLTLQMGRDFLPEEGEPGKDDRLILSNSLWRERFGADRDIVGKRVRLDGRPFTVVGVVAPGPADRVQHRMYTPLAFTPEQVNHTFHWLTVMGRLKPGITLEQANAEMATIAQRIADQFPDAKKGWGISVEPLQNNFLPPRTINGLKFLLAGVSFVLLIACANVANLLLARGATRQKEVAIRSSIGAAPRHIATQFLAESVVLAGAGGLVGTGLAVALMKLIVTLMPAFTLPSEVDVRLSVPVLAFTILTAMASGILFGCAPVVQALRHDVNDTLKEGGRSGGTGRHRVQRALVVAEFALALSLLAGGGLAIQSLMNLSRVRVGFPTERLLTFSLSPPAQRLPDAERIQGFYDRLQEKIRALPGVQATSAATGGPFAGSFGMGVDIAGEPRAQGSSRRNAAFLMVTPDYHRTYGINLVRGRTFDAGDRAGGANVAVVNESFVNAYLRGEDPLAQTVLVDRLIPGQTTVGEPVAWRIVGVVQDVRNRGLRNDVRPEIDVPFGQSPWPSARIAVRTTNDPNALRTSIARIVQEMDPDLAMAGVRTMQEQIDESMSNDRFHAMMFTAFAAIALALAAVGIYGVMSFAVAQRIHDLGIRMALGADRRRVVGLVMRDGMKTALTGTTLGFAGAYYVGRSMQGLWFGVGAIDLGRFATIALTLVAAAMVACYVPARRAARVDPLRALRSTIGT